MKLIISVVTFQEKVVEYGSFGDFHDVNKKTQVINEDDHQFVVSRTCFLKFDHDLNDRVSLCINILCN